MRKVLVVLSIALLAGFASASTVDFNAFTPLDVAQGLVSYQGLDFTSGNGIMYVFDAGSPNSNGTPGLIYAFGSPVTITKTGGGTFDLNSFDLTISWYDSIPSEIVTVFDGTNNYFLTVGQGLQTYNLNLLGVTSVTVSELPSGTGYWLMDNVVYNATPEPGTLALLGTGALAGLGALRRKLML